MQLLKTITCTLLVAVLLLPSALASPDAINYQSAVRGDDSELLRNENIELRFSIRSSSATGSIVYEETHDVSTNAYGMVNLSIGQGSANTGTFSDIDWANDDHFLQVELDAGNGFENMGTQQLVSVPYARFSNEAAIALEMELEHLNDLDVSAPQDGQVLMYDGALWTAQDIDMVENLEDLANVGADAPADNQVLYWDGNSWEAKDEETGLTEVQTDGAITGDGSGADPVTLDDQGATAGQVLKWDGSTWTPENEDGSNWTESGDDIYYDAGNVGIGTVSPLGPLHVQGSSIHEGDLFVISGSINNYIRFDTMSTGASGPRLIYSGESSFSTIDRFSLRGSQGLDINKFNGSAALDVEGDIAASDDINTEGNVNANGQMVVDANNSSTWSYIRFREASGTGNPRIYHSSNNDYMYLSGVNEVIVATDFSATGSKNFKIDHPADPANKYLYHAAIESDERFNKYSGNITTDGNGKAIVDLPDYVELINKDFRYQLTVIGSSTNAYIGEEVNNGSFVINTVEPDVKVSWELTGVRDDPYARQNPYEVEVDKQETEEGRYLMPALYDKSEEYEMDYEESNETDENEDKITPDFE